VGAVGESLAAARARVRAAEARYGRPPGSVALLAVSKGQPAAAVRAAWAAGQRAFGESYVSEALVKMEALADLGVEWHFIGPIQSNKTRAIAERFAWVHSVDRLKVASRLSAQRPSGLGALSVLLEVNVSGEATKAGVAPEDALALALEVSRLPGLRLRGLMAVPAPEDDPERQRTPFRRLRELFERLRSAGLALDTLSMGMSADLEAAVAEGATVVRVGTAIFGQRSDRRGGAAL
jgi:hypothetical protein